MLTEQPTQIAWNKTNILFMLLAQNQFPRYGSRKFSPFAFTKKQPLKGTNIHPVMKPISEPIK